MGAGEEAARRAHKRRRVASLLQGPVEAVAELRGAMGVPLAAPPQAAPTHAASAALPAVHAPQRTTAPRGLGGTASAADVAGVAAPARPAPDITRQELEELQ